MPIGFRNMVISNVEETSKEEMGMLSDGEGDRLDQELPDLYALVAPRPSKSSGQPPKKSSRKERRAREWEKRDLSPQEVSPMQHTVVQLLSVPHAT